jgi:cytochrome c-type biogenesis protein CcmH
MKSKAWLIILISLLAALLVFGSAAAQGTNPPGTVTDDQVNAVARQLYCPVCENIPLDVCPTQACTQWRDLIRQKLSQGWTADQIKQYFVAQYGDRVLATPPAHGLNWLVYFIPPIAILAGAFILYKAFKAWKKPLPEVTLDEVKQMVGDDYIMRLEEELKKR